MHAREHPLYSHGMVNLTKDLTKNIKYQMIAIISNSRPPILYGVRHFYDQGYNTSPRFMISHFFALSLP